jgi:hypothetical protein
MMDARNYTPNPYAHAWFFIFRFGDSNLTTPVTILKPRAVSTPSRAPEGVKHSHPFAKDAKGWGPSRRNG